MYKYQVLEILRSYHAGLTTICPGCGGKRSGSIQNYRIILQLEHNLYTPVMRLDVLSA